MAFQKVYIWYAGTSGLHLTIRLEHVQTPSPPRSNNDLANELEKWLEHVRQLAAYGDDYTLGWAFKITALQRIMAHNKEAFESWEGVYTGPPNSSELKYKYLLEKVQTFVTNRRRKIELSTIT